MLASRSAPLFASVLQSALRTPRPGMALRLSAALSGMGLASASASVAGPSASAQAGAAGAQGAVEGWRRWRWASAAPQQGHQGCAVVLRRPARAGGGGVLPTPSSASSQSLAGGTLRALGGTTSMAGKP